VNVSEAKRMIETNPYLIILDVRDQEEYVQGHIKNAVLIPYRELESRLAELDRERDILVYCAGGGRSAIASQILVDNGFRSVYNMLGGITAWRYYGYWIEIFHEGDLIIRGTDTYFIQNCTYIQTGNIYVADNATLTMKNSELVLNQTEIYQYAFPK
jgi:rhodanese-related sulfurtransferase